MAIKAIERFRFKMFGRSVPVLHACDITETGMVRTLQVAGDMKDRPNSIIKTWDGKGWEKSPDGHMINLIDEKGSGRLAYIVSEFGRTVNLYTEPRSSYPDLEDVIGRAATMDDIAEAMDLGKSVRNILLGGLISAPVWWIVFQILGQMAK
jgi:hypothetical protein